MVMKREQYREHLCSIIYMVFTAEHKVLEQNPHLLEHLRKENSNEAAENYVHIIADEILSKTPDNLIPEKDSEELHTDDVKTEDVPP